VEGLNEGPTAAVRPMTREQLGAFYAIEYGVLVRMLVIRGATIEEAEDAAQKAMADFVRRSQAAHLLARPAGYVRQAAVRFFIKERQRDRERRSREVRGDYLATGTHADDRLTILEGQHDIELILECLTPTQRQVVKLVMEGLSTAEIAEELGKSDETVRQHLKKGRDRLKGHPRVAPLAPRQGLDPGQDGAGSTVTAREPSKEEVQ
jgi:RNA polymerase sigma factor (sigma-70 family)